MADTNKMQNKSQSGDEVDLLQLFSSFFNWISRVFRGFFYVLLQILVYSIRKWVFILVGLIVGVGMAVLLSTVQSDYYFSDLIIKSNAVQNQEMISYLNRLDNLAAEQDKTYLEDALNLDSLTQAESITSIRGYWFVDLNKDGIVDRPDLEDRYLTDTSVVKVGWKMGVRAVVTDPEVLVRVTDGIKSYVASNDYFNQMNEVRIDNLKEIIQQTEKEVEKLDSLQKKEYFQRENLIESTYSYNHSFND